MSADYDKLKQEDAEKTTKLQLLMYDISTLSKIELNLIIFVFY